MAIYSRVDMAIARPEIKEREGKREYEREETEKQMQQKKQKKQKKHKKQRKQKSML